MVRTPTFPADSMDSVSEIPMLSEDKPDLSFLDMSHNTPPAYRRSFHLAVDPMQRDKATEIRLFTFRRPHMRAFHFAWLSFFVAFFGWFSIPPLMPTIKKDLQLTDDQVANSNIVSVAGTIFARVVVGPLCDRYGARTVQAILLVLGAIPVASATLVTDYVGLMFARFFIGLVGCSFVSTTYWTSSMFSSEVVGSANAIAAGWGNLGAGAAYFTMPLLFDLVTMDATVSPTYGWRITQFMPAVIMVIIGLALFLASDDCPHGNYTDLKKSYAMAASSPNDIKRGIATVGSMPIVWVLAFQYACSFGVELQVHNVLSLYYYEDFTIADCDPDAHEQNCRLLTQTQASLISSCFGLMCIFARAIGGYLSDVGNQYFDMKGRIGVQLVAFTCQAGFLLLFSQVRVVGWSIPCLVAFGICAQACTGSTFAIVPYISSNYGGVAAGFVGAGGNLGGLCWGFLFKGVGYRARAFEYLGFIVSGAALLSVSINIRGQPALWR